MGHNKWNPWKPKKATSEYETKGKIEIMQTTAGLKSTAKINYDTEKSPGDLRRLAIIHNSAENYQLEQEQ